MNSKNDLEARLVEIDAEREKLKQEKIALLLELAQLNNLIFEEQYHFAGWSELKIKDVTNLSLTQLTRCQNTYMNDIYHRNPALVDKAKLIYLVSKHRPILYINHKFVQDTKDKPFLLPTTYIPHDNPDLLSRSELDYILIHLIVLLTYACQTCANVSHITENHDSPAVPAFSSKICQVKL